MPQDLEPHTKGAVDALFAPLTVTPRFFFSSGGTGDSFSNGLSARMCDCLSVCLNISEGHMGRAQSRGSARRCPGAGADLRGHPHVTPSVFPTVSLWTVHSRGCSEKDWLPLLTGAQRCPWNDCSAKSLVWHGEVNKERVRRWARLCSGGGLDDHV